jgi:hypothetical protein
MNYRLGLVVFLCATVGLHAGTPPLTKLSHAEQQVQIQAGLAQVQVYRDGLRSVLAFVESRPDLFPVQKLKKPRLLRREEKEVVWTTWKSFLDYMLAIDALRSYHQHYYRLKGEEEQGAFLVGYAGFLAEYRFTLEFIDRVENDLNLDQLLNEPVPEVGLPKGTYSQLKFRFLNIRRATEFAARGVVYLAGGGGKSPKLRETIDEDREHIRKMGRGQAESLTAKNALKIVEDVSFSAYFPIQAGVSDWMGDTKVKRRGVSLVSAEQIRKLTSRLEPGDIILARHEWYLSNIGLPGFWPHGILYIGTPEERRAYFGDEAETLLQSQEPAAYAASAKPLHGATTRVIEAISEGVVFNSMEHAADADSIVALRPGLSKREKAAAIRRAFHYAGRPYDFNFDFRTDSAIVCTQLVYKSYEPATNNTGLRFPMIEMLGRPVLPANLIARQFHEQYGTPAQQLDFVAFIDGYEREKRAVESTLEAFRGSWRRPKWHVITQVKPAEVPRRE